MKKTVDYSVYLVTDKQLMTSASLEECVEQAILGGATLVQIREKNLSTLEFYEEAARVKKICDLYGVGLIVNDRIDVALAIHADGVHIGQSDMPASIARKIIGTDMILGVSAATTEQAIAAEKDGADYLGVGAMYATGTKSDAKILSKQTLTEIRKCTSLPVVVIGGINENTIQNFDDCDINGVAVVSAIIAKPDVTEAARQVKRLFYNTRKPRLNKNLALFDLDGTLLDSMGVWAEADKKFFQSRSMEMPSDFLDVTMPMSFLETALYAIEKFKFKDTPQGLIELWQKLAVAEYAHNVKLKPYAKEYLTQLKSSGVKLAVVTGLSKELYQPALKQCGIEQLFDKTFSVNEVSAGKNSGKIYEYAIKEFGEKPRDCILFEDIPAAATSGKKLGLTVVGIKDQYNRQTIAALSQICDVLLTDFYNAPILARIKSDKVQR